jgi:hypothetical protein
MPTLQDAPAADDEALDDNWSSNIEQCDFQTATVNKRPRTLSSSFTVGNVVRVLFYGPARPLILLALMGALVIAVTMYLCLNLSVTDQWAKQNKQLVTEWLDTLHNGESGGRFWSKESYVQPVKLFSVSSWEIVRYDSSCVWVRVDSSNTSGMPIRKLWKVQINGFNGSPHTYTPKITAVTDADSDK